MTAIKLNLMQSPITQIKMKLAALRTSQKTNKSRNLSPASGFHRPLALAFRLFIASITSFCLLLSPNSYANQLIDHNSPYLAMHGSDPVNWRLWQADILKQAQQENRLIFISSGYFSCHWCHVMQKENYRNTDTASYLNEHFISVKIDRELNPEIDKPLIEFARKTTGQAGWPQHVILTPEGYPIHAFIYLDNKTFNKRLKNINQLWQNQPDRIRALAAQFIAEEKAQLDTNHKQDNPDKVLTAKIFAEALFAQLRVRMDDFLGGLKGTNKFPVAPLLKSLLLYDDLPDDIDDWLALTLTQMQSEHLYDHVHGGFYRYSVDPNWQTPHFEKMLYDNAQLAQVYLLAYQRWQDKTYLDTALQTLNYITEQLYDPQNRMYLGSQSALDKHDNEGGDYLWNRAALENSLTSEEFALVNQAWLLQSAPPYDLGWHPKPIDSPLWQSIKGKLKKPHILTDSKNLLGWNGLLLSALSQAYLSSKQPQYLNQAEQLAHRLAVLIMQDKPPRAISGDQTLGEASLQDYAFIYQGLQDWQTVADKEPTPHHAEKLVPLIESKFLSPVGWRYNATPILPNQQGEAVMSDSFIPSPSALLNCLAPQYSQQHQALLLANAIDYAGYVINLDCRQSADIQ
ncbi:thioredoxin domain-containing protein [Thiomicrorhabdus sediminis]|nr:DUF255 domain-containing protein [Thiomicrorhabdus sediminis]